MLVRALPMTDLHTTSAVTWTGDAGAVAAWLPMPGGLYLAACVLTCSSGRGFLPPASGAPPTLSAQVAVLPWADEEAALQLLPGCVPPTACPPKKAIEKLPLPADCCCAVKRAPASVPAWLSAMHVLLPRLIPAAIVKSRVAGLLLPPD